MKPLNSQRLMPCLLMGLSLFLASCWGYNMSPPPEDFIRDEAYVPVYAQTSDEIKAMPVQPTVEPGKIYVWGNLLFQVERLVGVHVIDYTDKQNPVKLGFIKIRGCSEIAVKGNYLIANHMMDLVTIDVSKPNEVKEVARMKEAFPHFLADRYHNSRPPERGKYFVCPSFTKGEVIGWKLEKKVKNAHCYNN